MKALPRILFVLAIGACAAGCNTILPPPPDLGIWPKEMNTVYWRENTYYAMHSGVHRPSPP
jgi:hypothetical protein